MRCSNVNFKQEGQLEHIIKSNLGGHERSPPLAKSSMGDSERENRWNANELTTLRSHNLVSKYSQSQRNFKQDGSSLTDSNCSALKASVILQLTEKPTVAMLESATNEHNGSDEVHQHEMASHEGASKAQPYPETSAFTDMIKIEDTNRLKKQHERPKTDK